MLFVNHSNKADFCQSKHCTQSSHVWRYAKCTSPGVMDISCFLILKKDNGFLSLYHSDNSKIDKQVESISHEIEIKLRVKDPAMYFYFCVKEAKEETEDRVSFFEAGYPHIGMWYPNKDDLNDLEIRTIIFEISSYWQKFKKGNKIISAPRPILVNKN